MNLPEGVQRALSGLKKTGSYLFGGGLSNGEAGFICAACHSTYDRQHYQCPQCGEMVLVPVDADEGEPLNRGPG